MGRKNAQKLGKCAGWHGQVLLPVSSIAIFRIICLALLVAPPALAEVQTVKEPSAANKAAVAVTNPGPTGPFEQTEIRRSSAAASKPGGNGAASPTTWDMSKVPVALAAVIVLIFML